LLHLKGRKEMKQVEVSTKAKVEMKKSVKVGISQIDAGLNDLTTHPYPWRDTVMLRSHQKREMENKIVSPYMLVTSAHRWQGYPK
jgi:hypothetical protein